MRGTHASNEVSSIILELVRDRLGGRTSNYFVGDSDPVNMSAV